MKKQRVTAVVAAAAAMPIVAAADVTVYGLLHYSIDSINYGSNFGAAIPGTGMDSVGTGFDGLGVNSHSSRLGFKGSEDLGEGLGLVYQMEFTLDADDLGAFNNNRNTYVALTGDWGMLGVGQVDTPFKRSTFSLELFSEQVGDYNQLWFDDIRIQDAVFYMSPDWDGLSFAAALVMPSSDNDADGIEAASVSATYQKGPWFASLAYEGISDDMVNVLHGAALDYDKWRLGVGYTANGFHVGFVYEDRDLDDLHLVNPLFDDDGDSWQISGSYTIGNNTFKAAYGQVDGAVRATGIAGVIDDGEQWSIGLDHKLSTRTTVYATYADFDTDTSGSKYDALALGITHKF